MTGQTIVNLGTFALGEIPEPILITMKDATETVINLTGYTAKFEIVVVRGTVAGLGAGTTTITDAVNGITKYTWVEADFANEGTFRGQMWVGTGGTLKLGSFIYQYEVESITTAPSV